MPAITTITDEARIAVDNLLGTLAGGGTPTVRLGVTGLSRAGKTVFITALVHNLVHGGRLPLFDAYASGRLAEARLMPQPDDDVPRFDYEAHVRDLVEQARLAAIDAAHQRAAHRHRIRIGAHAEAHARPRPAQPRHRRLSRRMAARPRAPEEDPMPNGRPRRSRCRASRIAPALAAEWHAALAGADAGRPGGRGRGARGSPRPSRAICAPRAPTSTRSRCCRRAAS